MNGELPSMRNRTARSSRRKRPWVLIVCGLLLVLLLACGGLVSGGLYYAGVFGPRWRSFDLPGGGCRVDMPDAPTLEPTTSKVTGANVTAYSARRLIPDQEFGVGYFDVLGS